MHFVKNFPTGLTPSDIALVRDNNNWESRGFKPLYRIANSWENLKILDGFRRVAAPIAQHGTI